MKQARRFLSLVLDVLTSGALPDELADVVAHCGPEEVGLDVMQGFGETQMTTYGCGMKFFDQWRNKRVPRLEPDSIFREEKTITDGKSQGVMRGCG